MRVIAGSAKGRTLLGPKRDDPIRPVEDRVKESLFNILWDVTGLRILDAFAGTGAIGIEGLSRGAAHCTFIDQSPRAIALITANVERCGLLERATIVRASVDRALERLAKGTVPFDLLFIDPPYTQDLVAPTLAQLAATPLLAPAGRILIEHEHKLVLALPPTLQLTDQRTYGQTVVSFVRRMTINPG
ncbi:MAG: 16S rRNA (guanine(966)-N(2))-methyltransferase RsmD [Deltaproteobacteria bacterium]|nr:16S rRNA (guanine(966)-N(2))-methyltransferase RsmD [Deltaproteobacteria bacterium]